LKSKKLQQWMLALDLGWATVAIMITFAIRTGFSALLWQSRVVWVLLPVLGVALFLWSVLFYRMKLDGFDSGCYFPAIVSQLFLSTTFLVLLLIAVTRVGRYDLSPLALTYFGILLLAGVVTIRKVMHWVLRSIHFKGALRRVLVVGSGPVAREVAAKIGRHPEALRQVVGFLCSADSSLNLRSEMNESRTVVNTLGVIDLIREKRIDEILIASSNSPRSETTNLAALCRQQGIAVSLIPYPYELYLSKLQLVDVGGVPVIQLDDVNVSFANGLLKRLLDLVLTCMLIPISLPFLAFGVVTLIRARGGPFSKELRCGQFGKLFWMYRLNSDRKGSALLPSERLLQRLSITEIPQLWNVLKGDMSLVGPRPEPPDRVKHYSDWQMQRLNVKPGITGLAQAHGLREQHSSEDKARFDLQYLLHSSSVSDLSLLLQTAWILVARFFRGYEQGASEVEHPIAAPGGEIFERTLQNAHSAQSSAD